MANPFPFVAGDVLTAAELNGIGEFTSFTPTFTNLTVGNGTADGQFSRIQNFVAVFVTVVFGSTTSLTGDVTFNLPVNRLSLSQFALGTALFRDAGTDNFAGSVQPSGLSVSTANIRRHAVTAAPGSVSVTILSATTPFTWTTTDVLSFNMMYPAA